MMTTGRLARLDEGKIKLASFKDMKQAIEAYAAVFNGGLSAMGISRSRSVRSRNIVGTRWGMLLSRMATCSTV